MISQFHCGDKQFGNSYVRVCVVSNCTMGLFWIASFVGYYENEQEPGSKFAPKQSHGEVRHYTDTVQRTTSKWSNWCDHSNETSFLVLLSTHAWRC